MCLNQSSAGVSIGPCKIWWHYKTKSLFCRACEGNLKVKGTASDHRKGGDTRIMRPKLSAHSHLQVQLTAIRLGSVFPQHRLRLIPSCLQIRRDYLEKQCKALSFHLFQAHAIDAGTASVGFHFLPCPPQYIGPEYAVVECVERMIKCPDAIEPIRAALCRNSCTRLPRPRRRGRLAVKGFWLHHPSPHRQSPSPDEGRRWLLHHRRRQRDPQQLAHHSGSHRRC
jgi:hypothetical protein